MSETPAGASAGAVVETSRLTKVFRDFWRRPKVTAVDELSLRIAPGEIYGLLGPNGSGKSTTIKILLGLLHPTAGEAVVLGRPPRHVAAKRGIGYLPEESHLYPYLSPRETLTFYGRLFGLRAGIIRSRTAELLDMVGLAHAADRPVGEFSKGMMRRVGLAQALINDPRLVILDEPTSGLDPIGCRQIKDLMLVLARRGKTVLLSSHLLADVEDVCDRIGILFNGRLRAQGEVAQLLEKRDRIRFTVPCLSTEQLQTTLALLKQHAGSEPDVDHPSLNLEQFFLRVVREAHRDAGSAGSTAAGGAVPAWLGDREEAVS